MSTQVVLLACNLVFSQEVIFSKKLLLFKEFQFVWSNVQHLRNMYSNCLWIRLLLRGVREERKSLILFEPKVWYLVILWFSSDKRSFELLVGHCFIAIAQALSNIRRKSSDHLSRIYKVEAKSVHEVIQKLPSRIWKLSTFGSLSPRLRRVLIDPRSFAYNNYR
jgi:hypothetical protein